MNTQTSAAIRHNSRLVTLSALFAAMITLTTAYLFHIPIGSNGGYMHFGDAFIYLAASILPTPYACAAAAIGGGLADFVSGVPIWIIPTVIIKPLTAVWFTNKKARLLCRQNVAALFLAGIVSNTGYYLAEVFFTGNWIGPLAAQWGGLLQSGGSAIVFVILAAALDKLNFKDQFKFIGR
ncbi:TIGR04002 family protein [Youxingia wuxianensis]|uniref:TIGR04002 family protein n=1 Tax=Youxingia wuxianensis TaxID=2763678 RepID=A0A926EPW2_9FIRM|nr:TIGR04002 family protein [Youxingia wuxianensis]MBC8584140.1 TIGR04002 family protein [Youxingia wuxianensis]